VKLHFPAMILILLASACFAGSKETAAVSVAVAVDHVLQTNTPDLPKTPVRPRGDIQEPPVPQKQRVKVRVHSPSSFVCAPCEAMKAEAERDGWKSGDIDIEIEWVREDVVGATAYPWITSPGKINIYGRTNIRGLRMWLGLPAVKPSQAAIGAVQ
jgi:hypothetical protein